MIDRAVRRGRLFVRQLADGGREQATADLRRWAWSQSEAVGLRCARGVVASPPKATVALEARPLDDELAARLFDVDGLGPDDRLFLERRRNIYEAGFDGGWVAVDDTGEPAYLQWLIPGRAADAVHDFFGPIFPRLPPDTLHVEGAWIPPAFRKRKVMGEGLALVTAAAFAAEPDARVAICYPAADNRGAVVGTRSAGYEVFEKRTERWRLGRRTTSFAPASEADFAVLRPVSP